MKLIQIAASLSRSAGGPFVSVRRLAQELISQGVQVEAAGIVDHFFEEDQLHWKPVLLRAVSKGFPQFYSYSSSLREQISISNPDIVHSHGVWLYPNLAAYRHCTATQTPLVVSTRGMLEPWAFKNNAWKKRPLWWAYEKRALLSARVLHATAVQEAEALRALGLSNPIAVIPNGVDLPGNYEHILSSTGERIGLFLSRIHPKKGLMNLIEAWSNIRPVGWRMVISGPEEMGHEIELREAIERAGLNNCFYFVGPAYDEQKEQLYRQADLFILPTFSENFGIAIAEALAYGVPVITTKGAPWECLIMQKCGWWVDIGVKPLEYALREACALPRDVLHDMGSRGRVLMDREFSWQSIAKSMKAVYEWVLYGGTPPDCVRFD